MDTTYNTNGCFYRALDDEPVFVLLARDPCFAEAVRWWVTLRQALIGRGEKPLEDHGVLAEALATASAGSIWRSDATDSVASLEEPRWHKEHAPKRELVASDRIANLETRLLKNANRFLQYAQNHFDKGTAESDAKGEVNWSEYLDICADLNISPADKPVASKDPKSDRDRLPYDDWLTWKAAAMPIGNDFLLGLHKGKLWFSQRQHHKSGEREWSDLYMLQNSLQCDMIRGMYNDYRTRQTDRADRLKGMLPDYKGIMAKIAVGLRQVTANMIGQSEARMEDTSVEAKGFLAEAVDQYADQINGYALELETESTITAHESYPNVQPRKIGMVPELAMGYGQSAKAPTDMVDVTDTPDMPPHRFTMFTKAKGWAYGRGLEINPSHIPDMLDRMDADGWHLQCVFGGVVPDKVGMLFRRFHNGGPVSPYVREMWAEIDVEPPYVKPLPPSVAEMMDAPTEGLDYGRGQQP